MNEDHQADILITDGKREKKLLQELADNQMNDEKQPQDSEHGVDDAKHKLPI